MENHKFFLQEDHVKLLKRMYVGWQYTEYGAPEIDPKRPYGNSDVTRDIFEIINDGEWGNNEWDEEMGMPANLTPNDWRNVQEYLKKLHKETETALQIVLRTGEMRLGKYEAEPYRQNWRLVEPWDEDGETE